MVQEQLAAISDAVKTLEVDPDRETVELSNGIVLRCKAVPIMTIRYAHNSVPRPTPPVVRNEDKQRDEVWEGDPQYQDALAAWQERIGEVGTNVMLGLGTKIETVPDGMFNPEDEEWCEPLVASGLSVNLESKSARYLSWLRFYALSTPQDLANVSILVAMKSGVVNKDVQASLDSFRGGEDGRTDLGGEDEKHSGDGDRVPSSDSRPHLRSGGER